MNIYQQIEDMISRASKALEIYRSDINLIVDGKPVNMVKFDPNFFVRFQTEIEDLVLKCDYINKSKINDIEKIFGVIINGFNDITVFSEKMSIKNLWGLLERNKFDKKFVGGVSSVSSALNQGLNKQVEGYAERQESFTDIGRTLTVPSFIDGKRYIDDKVWNNKGEAGFSHADRLPGYRVYSCIIEIMMISYIEILKEALAVISNKSANEKNDGQK